MADYSYYTRRIRDIREDNDLTQQQIAEILGTSQTMYARYERGANELPIRHLIKLAEYYRLSTDYLLGLTNDKKPHSFSSRLYFICTRRLGRHNYSAVVEIISFLL